MNAPQQSAWEGRRERVGSLPANGIGDKPTKVSDHSGAVIRGNQWRVRQHQQSQRCQRVQTEA
ncbi:MAG: hypothetical protein ACOVQK_00825 [Cyanobium sp.]